MKSFCYTILSIAFASCSTSRVNSVRTSKQVKVELITDSGTIVLSLYNQTPMHRDNFVKLIKEKFYDGLLFHRVIQNFMIQGGDPASKNALPGAMLGEGSLKYTIPAEFDTALFHKKGALAAARESDDVNPKKASSATQFYIVEGEVYSSKKLDRIEEQFKIKIPPNHRKVYETEGGTPFLDMNYTVFGEVISGLNVVEKIAHAKKDENDRPLKDIKMKIRLLK